jgi:hypothetical protein
MMGTATVELRPEIVAKLKQPPFNDMITFRSESETGDGYIISTIHSVLLPAGYQGVMEVIIDGERVSFKRWADT